MNSLNRTIWFATTSIALMIGLIGGYYISKKTKSTTDELTRITKTLKQHQHEMDPIAQQQLKAKAYQILANPHEPMTILEDVDFGPLDEQFIDQNDLDPDLYSKAMQNNPFFKKIELNNTQKVELKSIF